MKTGNCRGKLNKKNSWSLKCYYTKHECVVGGKEGWWKWSRNYSKNFTACEIRIKLDESVLEINWNVAKIYYNIGN